MFGGIAGRYGSGWGDTTWDATSTTTTRKKPACQAGRRSTTQHGLGA
jgi:hypothetical protein